MEVIVFGKRLLFATLSLGRQILCHGLIKRQAREDALRGIGAISSGTDQFSNPDQMDASFLLGIWVRHQVKFRLSAKIRNLGQGNEIIDFLALKLEVEARELECCRQVDDGLPNLVDLLLGRYL